MRKKYKIAAVLHSGRKGIRGTMCADPKYADILGSFGWVDVDKIKQFEKYKIDLINNKIFDYWTTSEVLGLVQDRENGDLEIETANSLYELEALRDGEEDTTNV